MEKEIVSLSSETSSISSISQRITSSFFSTITNVFADLTIPDLISYMDYTINENFKIFYLLLNETERMQVISKQLLTPFYSTEVATNQFFVKNYLTQTVFSFEMETSTIILMCVYIDRFCEQNKFYLNINNIKRYFFDFDFIYY